MDTVLEHPALEDQDESVRIAVRALGDMRNSVHTSPTTCESLAVVAVRCPSEPRTAFQPTPALSSTSGSSSPSLPEEDSPDFVSRVSHLPIVTTAIRAYEHGKASSRVVKVCLARLHSRVSRSSPHALS